MLRALFNRFRPEQPAAAPQDQDQTALIDQLMAGPVKQRPKITVFGDDDVVGINPAPLSETSANEA